MKHTIKHSFWALGVIVLIFSQLLAALPTRHAAAEATLSFSSVQTQTYKYSLYAAMRSCTTTQSNYRGLATNEALTSINDSLKPYTNGPLGAIYKAVVIGYTGSEEPNGNGDGQVFCHEARDLWVTAGGYGDLATMFESIGFKLSQDRKNVIWPKDYNPSALEASAKKQGVPTSLPTWGKYVAAVSAMKAKCALGSKILSAGTATAAIVDDSGNLSTMTYADSTGVSAYSPGGRLNNETGGMSCSELAAITNDANEGAAAFVKAIYESRIQDTIIASEMAICKKLNLTGKALDHCQTDFNGWIKQCIDSYYATGGGGLAEHGSDTSVSKSEPFDNDTVAACVAKKANANGYNSISADDISAILGDAQNNASTVTASSQATPDICDILGDKVPMKWLACGILTVMNGVANVLYDMVENLLYTPVSQIFDSDKYNTSIDTFRVFGMAFVFIVGLIMVIAQATGSDIVDAYTVRKVLPKLAIAIIGIAIAAPLLKFFVTFINDIGIAAGNFITDTTPSAAINSNTVKSDVVKTLVATDVLGTIGLFTAAIAVVAQGPAALTYIVVAVVAILIAFLTLALRQLLIVVLILFAPIAIAASILPGTEKLWKFWRTTLITTLMMFPIIMVFLKSGVFMAAIFGSMGDSGNPLYYFVAAIVFIAPYFMVPLAFKMAGGLVGNVFGMFNDRSRGLFDRMRNLRGNSTKKNMQAMKEGTRFRDRNGAWSSINRGLQQATNLDKVDWFSKDRRGQMAAWQATEEHRKAIQGAKENEFFNTFGQDDAVLKAAGMAGRGREAVMAALAANDSNRFGTDTAAKRAATEQAASLIMRGRQTMGAGVFSKAVALSKPGTGTAYNQKDAQGNTFANYAQGIADVGEAYADDAVGWQSALVNLRSGLANSGHAVGGASVGTWLAAARMKQNKKSDEEINAFLHEQAAKELAPGQGAQGKVYAVRENAKGAVRRLEKMIEARKTGTEFVDSYEADGTPKTGQKVTDEMIEYEIAKAASSLEAIGQAPGEAGDEFARILQGAKIHLGGAGDERTVRELITDFEKTNPDGTPTHEYFNQRKKYYSSGYAAEGAAAGAAAAKPPETPPEPK